jgi:hypothetical protein
LSFNIVSIRKVTSGLHSWANFHPSNHKGVAYSPTVPIEEPHGSLGSCCGTASLNPCPSEIGLESSNATQGSCYGTASLNPCSSEIGLESSNATQHEPPSKISFGNDITGKKLVM